MRITSKKTIKIVVTITIIAIVGDWSRWSCLPLAKNRPRQSGVSLSHALMFLSPTNIKYRNFIQKTSIPTWIIQPNQAPIPWENRSSGSSSRQSAELKEFLSGLPRDLILRVHQKFLLDYKMFGYDIDTALKLGGHKPLAGGNWCNPNAMTTEAFATKIALGKVIILNY